MSKHTPGPWRWEVNEKSKIIQLCGGRPTYDLTVMDFVRWGMGNAIPRFRDNEDHGLLERCIKWAKKVVGREHHAHWFKSLDHPDARLIAAAPDLLEALEAALESLEEKAKEARSFWSHGDKFGEAAAAEGIYDSARAAIAKAKGEDHA